MLLLNWKKRNNIIKYNTQNLVIQSYIIVYDLISFDLYKYNFND